jgi:L-amino acid N-acyltransferase YncA
MKNSLKKIINFPFNLVNRYYRVIQDHFGHFKVKKYTLSSKKIRTFNDDDLERVLDLSYGCFGKKYFPQVIRYSRLFRNIFYIYEEDGIILAYFGFYVHLHLENLKIVQTATFFLGCVDKNRRGEGIFTTIYKECLSELKNNTVKNVRVCIKVNNSASLHVHKKLGFNIKDKKSDICRGNNFYQLELTLDECTFL